MKNRIPKNSHRLFDDKPRVALPNEGSVAEINEGGHRSAFGKTQQRYTTIALAVAGIPGAVLILLGHPELGKGLILGTLFSVVNFLLMAIALPFRLGKSRSKTLMISLSSIYLRYAILAIPLIWALKTEAIALPTVVVGLVMVQVAIVGDHVMSRFRRSLETG